jgi:hypothetical protein
MFMFSSVSKAVPVKELPLPLALVSQSAGLLHLQLKDINIHLASSNVRSTDRATVNRFVRKKSIELLRSVVLAFQLLKFLRRRKGEQEDFLVA